MTNQKHQYVLRESERARLESAREAMKNTTRVTPGGIVVTVDRAGRMATAQLDVHALLLLSRDVNEAIVQARMGNDAAPDTLRNIELPTVPNNEPPTF